MTKDFGYSCEIPSDMVFLGDKARLPGGRCLFDREARSDKAMVSLVVGYWGSLLQAGIELLRPTSSIAALQSWVSFQSISTVTFAPDMFILQVRYVT
jgi:hypothetical protein